MLPAVLSINTAKASGVINERMTNANRMNRVERTRKLAARRVPPPACLRVTGLELMFITSARDFFLAGIDIPNRPIESKLA
jgi:hypothetical protein